MLSRDREITQGRIVGTPQNPAPVVSLGRHWNSCQTSVLSYLGFGSLRAIVSSLQREVSQFLSRSKSWPWVRFEGTTHQNNSAIIDSSAPLLLLGGPSNCGPMRGPSLPSSQGLSPLWLSWLRGSEKGCQCGAVPFCFVNEVSQED